MSEIIVALGVAIEFLFIFIFAALFTIIVYYITKCPSTSRCCICQKDRLGEELPLINSQDERGLNYVARENT